MNLWAWLYQWQPAPVHSIICYPVPWLLQLDGEVFAVSPGQACTEWCDHIAFCDAPEGPRREP